MSSKGPLRMATGSGSIFDCNHRVCSAEQFQQFVVLSSMSLGSFGSSISAFYTQGPYRKHRSSFLGSQMFVLLSMMFVCSFTGRLGRVLESHLRPYVGICLSFLFCPFLPGKVGHHSAFQGRCK